MKKAHMIWKAKQQRKLTDEQIAYFLDRHPRWDLLLEYARCIRHGKTEREALDIVRSTFSNDPPLMPGDPDNCLGNGEHDFECCCDECGRFLTCFPEHGTSTVPEDWDHQPYYPPKK